MSLERVDPGDSGAGLVEVFVDSVAYGGAGVGRVDGKVYFVPFTIPGERVLARPVRDRKRFCEARLVSVVSASERRRVARCPVFGRCGGCAYQHVDYAVQLEWKRAQVAELFSRVARLPDAPVKPTVPSPEPWGYRNRIRVHVRGGCVGFFERDSRQVVEVEACVIAAEPVNAALARFRSERPEDGERTLSARPGVKFFEQTNDGAASALVGVVAEGMRGGRALLVDAYCGAGFFGRTFAPRFDRVVGIESHEGAVAAARRGATGKERYLAGDVGVLLGEVLEAARREAAVVLLDPPAAGVCARVVDLLVAMPVGELVYVSCDPGTQARDVKA
ncbi:MAG: hypothetical protein RLZZ142_2835, partial [Verrucomicrobiota bacterium]